MSKKIIIIGGHGKVGLRLARLLSGTHSVTSAIRDATQEADIRAASATPVRLDLETSTMAEFSAAFTGFDVVVFAAGAQYDAPEEVFQKVDLGGSLKVFDALEAIAEPKPKLVLLSAVDVRDPAKVPAHYDEDDVKESALIHQWVGNYMKYKFEADKDLVKRTGFKWTILRAGGMTDDAGTGKAAAGRTHITRRVTRDDVAQALVLLIKRDDANHLAIDFVGGDVPLGEALDAAIKKGETDFAE